MSDGVVFRALQECALSEGEFGHLAPVRAAYLLLTICKRCRNPKVIENILIKGPGMGMFAPREARAAPSANLVGAARSNGAAVDVNA